MTSTPAPDATLLPRPVVSGWRAPVALCVFLGWSAFLAEQAFAKYLQLQTGPAVLPLAYFLGFAAGSLTAAALLRHGRVRKPLPAYGIAQLAAGAVCAAFPYCYDSVLSPLLVLAVAALMGASFPLITQALDNAESGSKKRCNAAYTASLAGALAASLAAPILIMPAIGPRGALCTCFIAGVAACVAAAGLPNGGAPAVAPAGMPIGHSVRRLLASSFGAGALVFALIVIWAHLGAVVLGSSAYALSWITAAVLLGLAAGAMFADRVALRTSALFQCAALLLTAQLVAWDRVPGVFRFAPTQFYLAEIFRFFMAVLLLAPTAAVLGLIYPRVLASPHLNGENDAHLAGYLNAANALGCLTGVLLGIFVLVPLAGAEVALKTLVLVSALFWLAFLLREPLGRRRVATAVISGAVILIVLFGRWWNWGTLTAGPGLFRTHAPTKDVRYLPPSLVLKQEDMQAGFTTVVEQTVVSGEAAQTIRTLFINGVFQGDDNLDSGDGSPTIGSQFVGDYGRALVIGLGTGHGAAALKRLGYREIFVAEPSPAVVKAARECFSGFNEGILSDPRVKFYADDGRVVLRDGAGTPYDLIAVARGLYSREFYQLARTRLRTGGVFQQSLELDRVSPREIAAQLATAGGVFRHVSLWSYGGRGVLVAADHPLTPRGAGNAAPLLDSDGVARVIAQLHPPIDTDHNRWPEYAAPRSASDDKTHNLEFLRRYR
jgi:spermidine synthase